MKTWLVLFIAVLSSVSGEEDARPHVHQECVISDDNDCAFDSMTEPTLVYPGGNSRCAFDDNPSLQTNQTYRFQVLPGKGEDRRKVIVSLQQGGGCFSEESCNWSVSVLLHGVAGGPIFVSKPEPNGKHGMMDTDNPNNPFRNWTIINILYCTGDIFIGNTVVQPLKSKIKVHLNGANNTETTLNWVYKHIKNPTHLALGGRSAGALGIQVWAHSILTHYKKVAPAARFSVLTDSFIGLMPSNQGEFVPFIGACDERFGFSADLLKDCHKGELQLSEFLLQTVDKYRDVPFAYLTAKDDSIQKMFYCMVKSSHSLVGAALNFGSCTKQKAFIGGVNELLNSYIEPENTENNVISYQVNGDHHIFVDKDIFYTAETGESVGLPDWVYSVAMNDPKRTIESQCNAVRQKDKDFGCNKRLMTAKFIGADIRPESESRDVNQQDPNNAASSTSSSMFLVVITLMVVVQFL